MAPDGRGGPSVTAVRGRGHHLLADFLGSLLDAGGLAYGRRVLACRPPPGSGTGVRITDIYGERLTVDGTAVQPDVAQPTGVQFARH